MVLCISLIFWAVWIVKPLEDYNMILIDYSLEPVLLSILWSLCSILYYFLGEHIKLLTTQWTVSSLWLTFRWKLIISKNQKPIKKSPITNIYWFNILSFDYYFREENKTGFFTIFDYSMGWTIDLKFKIQTHTSQLDIWTSKILGRKIVNFLWFMIGNSFIISIQSIHQEIE